MDVYQSNVSALKNDIAVFQKRTGRPVHITSYRAGSQIFRASMFDREWSPEGVYLHYEGEPEVCAHCYTEVPSAYGPIE